MNLWEKEMSLCRRLVNKNVQKVWELDKIKTEKLFDNIKNNKACFDINDDDIFIDLKENLGIDHNTDKKLKSGKIKIDKTVDFHGLKLDEAFDLLLKSINDGYRDSLRNILFITGKGKNSVGGRETIKTSMEKWLKHPLIAGKVIKYCQATKKDGGSGAFYVFLRREKRLSNRPGA
ncbi:MAG: Smr/MutS family protein [Rickettsiales bacterium]|jgi:DNA-nicking Smr family endonuclease|nr:Smr/MutS family protein [Rickettsiales bacterium]